MSAGAPLEVAIIGGGTMGLAAAWALARRGARVDVLEARGHLHSMGSHGGHTRVIRRAYHEGSDYVALVSRADDEWTALAARVGEQLLVRCGLLEFGPDDDPGFAAARAALRDNDIEHELLDAATTRERYGFRIPAHWPACLAPPAGYLRVGPCLDALRREAEAAGARLHHHTRVRELLHGGEGPRLQLEDGTILTADRIIVAAGAWSKRLLGAAGCPRPLQVQRRVLAWTRPDEPVRARLRALPVWAAFIPEGFFYGFPDNDEGCGGFKLACHTSSDPRLAFMDEPVDPETVDRDIHDIDLEPLRAFLARYRPDAGDIATATTCLYTSTDSGDFCIEQHPADDRVFLATGFSGHGFKFAPAIGLGLAEWMLDGDSELILERFRARKRVEDPPPPRALGSAVE